MVNGGDLVDVGFSVKRKLIHKAELNEVSRRPFLSCRVIRVAEVAFQ